MKMLKQKLRALVNLPKVKRLLIEIPIISRKLYPGWERKNPFDRQFGVDTSGFVPVEQINAELATKINPYGASQASIIRKGIESLGYINDYTFIDLGCGKGRAMLVGGEFPFLSVIGIELSNKLAEIATRNVRIIETRFPHRTKTKVFNANALEFDYPAGNIVIYFYHSFGRELLAEMISKIKAGLQSGHFTHLFFVYYNPVHGDMLDTAPEFARWYAATLPYDPVTERGYGPDNSDTIVIWQSRVGFKESPHVNANSKITITSPLWRAEII
jgi:SAM-dependent methyltransferase